MSKLPDSVMAEIRKIDGSSREQRFAQSWLALFCIMEAVAPKGWHALETETGHVTENACLAILEMSEKAKKYDEAADALHRNIVNISVRKTEQGQPMGYSPAYLEGHRDARHAACEVVMNYFAKEQNV
jgi:hypothetical protein